MRAAALLNSPLVSTTQAQCRQEMYDHYAAAAAAQTPKTQS